MPKARVDRLARALRLASLAACMTAASVTANAQSSAWTQPPTGNEPAAHAPYTLDSLIRLALSISPRNREAQEGVRQADLATQLVQGRYAPQVDLKALGGFQHTPLAIPQTVSPRGYFVSHAREVIPSLELKWLLFDFGRRKAQLDEARENAAAAQAGFSEEQQKLVYAVSQAFFASTSAQGKVRAARQALDAARLSEQAIQAQRAHGRATVVQVAEAHRQTAATQVRMTKAQGESDVALAELVATVGLPAGTPLVLVAPSPTASADTPLPALPALIDRAMNTRPDIQAALSKLSATQAAVANAHAAYHPTISLQAQVFQNIGETSSDGSPYSSINREGNSVFVAFELPLSDGGTRATKVSIAMSQRDEAAAALDEARNTAAQQVVQCYSELKTSLDNRHQAVEYTHAADLAYQSAMDAYKHGLATVDELASNQAALAQAQSDEEDAEANVQVSQAALALAIGTPPGT